MSGPLPPACDDEQNRGSTTSKSRSASMRSPKTEPTMTRQQMMPTRGFNVRLRNPTKVSEDLRREREPRQEDQPKPAHLRAAAGARRSPLRERGHLSRQLAERAFDGREPLVER